VRRVCSKRALAVRLRREFSGKTLQEITIQDVERFKGKLKEEIALATVNLKPAVLFISFR
jgi:hypothetical protein